MSSAHSQHGMYQFMFTVMLCLSCSVYFVIVIVCTLSYSVVPGFNFSALQCFVIVTVRTLSKLQFNNNKIFTESEPLVYTRALCAVQKHTHKLIQARTVQIKEKQRTTRQQQQSQANPWTVHQQIQPTSHKHIRTHTHTTASQLQLW